MYDHTLFLNLQIARSDIRHTHKMDCQPGVSIWWLQYSSGMWVSIYGLTYSLMTPGGLYIMMMIVLVHNMTSFNIHYPKVMFLKLHTAAYTLKPPRQITVASAITRLTVHLFSHLLFCNRNRTMLFMTQDVLTETRCHQTLPQTETPYSGL